MTARANRRRKARARRRLSVWWGQRPVIAITLDVRRWVEAMRTYVPRPDDYVPPLYLSPGQLMRRDAP